MSSVSVPVIRNQLRSCISSLRSQQRRFARVQDVRFVATHRDTDRIIDRYREKLDKKAKQEGHESISSLKEAYKDKITNLRRAASTASKGPSAAAAPSASKHSPFQPPPAPSPAQSTFPPPPTPKSPSSTTPGIKPLSSYLDLAKVSGLPNKEIEYIWRLRHASDPLSLCAVIPIETYSRIVRTAMTHPQFILPLPRPAAEDGSGDAQQAAQGFNDKSGNRTAADIHFLQWGFHPPATPPTPAQQDMKTHNTHTSTVLFTHLASYKLHGAYAPPHTTVTHHLDLADSHGLVLLNGSVMEGKGVSVEEGRWLVMCLQKFYDFEGHGGGVGKEKRQGLLEKFSKGDEGFKIEELVDEAERVS